MMTQKEEVPSSSSPTVHVGTEGGRNPVVHLSVAFADTMSPVIVRGGVVFSPPGLEAYRVVMVIGLASRLALGLCAPFVEKSLVVWSEPEGAEPSEWVRIDDHAPLRLSATQATDLLMIADRALRLAGAAGEESQVPEVQSPTSQSSKSEEVSP